MEQFGNKELNKSEGLAYRLKLTDHASEIIGTRVTETIPELIKILAIIQHIQNNCTTIKDAERTAFDLFSEFDVERFKFDKVFSPDSLFRILKSEPIKEIAARFHNADLIIKSDSTVDSVIAEYDAKTAHDLAEVAQQKKNYAEQVARQQLIIDEMLSKVDSLDFSNIESLVDWLYSYNKQLINGVNEHQEILIAKFGEHGYTTDKSNKLEAELSYALKDKRRFGEVLIADMLLNPGLFERGAEMAKQISEWKESFF